ncbi:hypothetical protein Cni_G14427 [Canna indica]|uniref:Uncharacterized protein n=1 Tax=Canna indica TaxID=4628 RepID=A0AAQ3QE00_9LILI|nr:hypothetical protein Cni_G14427 [Canna indica]
MGEPLQQRQKSDILAAVEGFFSRLHSDNLPESAQKKGFFSDLLRGRLKVDSIEPGHVTCSFTVNSAVTVRTLPAPRFSFFASFSLSNHLRSLSLSCIECVQHVAWRGSGVRGRDGLAGLREDGGRG